MAVVYIPESDSEQVEKDLIFILTEFKDLSMKQSYSVEATRAVELVTKTVLRDLHTENTKARRWRKNDGQG